MHTDVDLAKLLVGQTKILGGNVVKSDKCMGDSQILEARGPAAPLSLHLCTCSIAGVDLLCGHSLQSLIAHFAL